jgi:hypothetical protein
MHKRILSALLFLNLICSPAYAAESPQTIKPIDNRPAIKAQMNKHLKQIYLLGEKSPDNKQLYYQVMTSASYMLHRMQRQDISQEVVTKEVEKLDKMLSDKEFTPKEAKEWLKESSPLITYTRTPVTQPDAGGTQPDTSVTPQK